jgi:hypothetical protein
MTSRLIPSVKRLVPLDDCAMGRENSGEPASDIVVEVLSERDDGELHIAWMPGIGVRAPFDESPRKVIQGSPKVVDRVADQCTPSAGGRVDGRNLVDESIGLRIELFPDVKRWLAVAVSFGPLLDLSLESIDVMFRPVELQPAVSQRLSHGIHTR